MTYKDLPRRAFDVFMPVYSDPISTLSLTELAKPL
jgi:hypothetical protein